MNNFSASAKKLARASSTLASLGLPAMLLLGSPPAACQVVALDGSVPGTARAHAGRQPDPSRDEARLSWPTATRLAGTVALVGASVLLDRPADRWAIRHHLNGAIRILRAVGDDAPIALATLAAGDALFRSDSDDGQVAWQAVKASVATATIVEITKIGVDRSRPTQERGASDFGHEKRADSSFPSLHTAVAWSVITPYAERYDAPWLYGLAALTNFSRVAGRDHWLSDTIAGAAIGWWTGDLFHRRSVADGQSTASVFIMPHGLG